MFRDFYNPLYVCLFMYFREHSKWLSRFCLWVWVGPILYLTPLWILRGREDTHMKVSEKGDSSRWKSTENIVKETKIFREDISIYMESRTLYMLKKGYKGDVNHTFFHSKVWIKEVRRIEVNDRISHSQWYCFYIWPTIFVVANKLCQTPSTVQVPVP